MKLWKKSFETYFRKLNMKIKIWNWENFEQNNESVALDVSFSSKDSEEITLLYKSKYNLEQENKVLLLMINDDDNENIIILW